MSKEVSSVYKHHMGVSCQISVSTTGNQFLSPSLIPLHLSIIISSWGHHYYSLFGPLPPFFPFWTLQTDWLLKNQIWTYFFPAQPLSLTPHCPQDKYTLHARAELSPCGLRQLPLLPSSSLALSPLGHVPWVSATLQEERIILYPKLFLLCRENRSESNKLPLCILKSSSKDCLTISREHGWKDSYIGWEAHSNQPLLWFFKTQLIA